MSQSLNIPNFIKTNVGEKTYVTNDVATGVASLPVANNQGFVGNDYVILGALASEVSELLIVSSVATPGIITTTTNTLRPHKVNKPVTKIFGNQLKIYRAPATGSASPADASFSLIDTIDIDTDQSQTTYTDATGSAEYWYKYTYYNSTTTGETNLSDSIAVRGGGVGNYASIESIRIKAGFQNNRYITDTRIDEKRQAAQQEINSQLQGLYTLPFVSPINPLIAEITREIAAGMLLTDDYGPQNTTTTNDGEQMLKHGREMLNKLETKQLVLTDGSGADTSIPGTGASFGGWPNNTTATTHGLSGGGERKFRVSDRY